MNRFINYIQKITRTDVRYLMRGSFWLIVAGVLSSLIGFGLAVAFANWVPKETYGTYKYILSLAGIIGALTMTGMGTAVTSAVARGFEGTVRTAFRVRIFWGLIVLLVGLFGAAYYWWNGNNTLAVALVLIGIFMPLIETSKLFGNFLVGKKNFRMSGIYSVLFKLLPTLVLLAAIFLTDNLLVIISVYFISYAVVALVLYWSMLIIYKPNDKQDPAALKYGIHLSFINVLSDVAQYVDQIIVFHFLGAVQLAVYNLAFVVPVKSRGLLRQVGQLALPKFSARQPEVIVKTLPRKLGLMFLLVVALIIIYIVAAPAIFNLLFPQYQEAVFYSQLAAPVMIGSLIPIINAAFLAHKKIKTVSALTIIQPLIRIALIVGFWYWLGFIGLIAARIIDQWVGVAVYGVTLKYLKTIS